MLPTNPFRTHGDIVPPYFTGRADEVRRVRSAMLYTPARLLVYGARRMGKTAVLHAARRAALRRTGLVAYADLSAASTPVDVANRVLEGVVKGLGATWEDLAATLVSRIRIPLELVPDARSGLAIPAIEASLRARDPADQYDSFLAVLDALGALAAERDASVALVLDEFQVIHRFGGELAERRLRDAIGRHERLSYVVAGSETALITEMTSPNRPFHQVFDLLALGPIEPSPLARWIDDRLLAAGATVEGVGPIAVQLAGPRTGDVVRLAHAAFEVLREESPPPDPLAVVQTALARVVAEEDDAMRTTWATLTPVQQNVLRAVAWNGAGLAARATLQRFGVGHGGTARNTALALVARGILEPSSTSATGFSFASPFVRAWIVANALPDVGIHVVGGSWLG
ncbi:MAG TPA: AAA family ATPase [Gemmatimonadaceae bacterium]